MISISKFKKLH